MHTVLIVLASLISNSTPAPAAVLTPGPMVLDGCNTQSAIRTAEIRLMPIDHPRTRELLDELLDKPDGAICLMESNVLVDLHRAKNNGALVARALAANLSSGKPHLVARAQELVAAIGRSEPSGFGKLLRRIEVNQSLMGPKIVQRDVTSAE